MDNFTHIKIQKLCSLLIILLTAVLLQACGAREEPFDGDSDGRGAAIDIEILKSADTPVGAVDANYKLVVLRDEAKFQTSWNLYTNTTDYPDRDFDKGQVVLIDAGRKSACDAKASVKDVKAYEYDDNKVQVVIDYRSTSTASSTSSSSSSASSVSSSSSSSCGNSTMVQRYYYYYVESRNEIFFEEEHDKQ